MRRIDYEFIFGFVEFGVILRYFCGCVKSVIGCIIWNLEKGFGIGGKM